MDQIVKVCPKTFKLQYWQLLIDYVVRVLSHDGTIIGDETMKLVFDFPEPTRVKQVQSFIGPVITFVHSFHFVLNVVCKYFITVELITIHRQILMEKDFQHLSEASNPSSGFAVDSYFLLEPVNCPKGRLHTCRLGLFQVIGSKFNYYTLLNEVAKREFTTNVILMVLYYFNSNRVERVLEHERNLKQMKVR